MENGNLKEKNQPLVNIPKLRTSSDMSVEGMLLRKIKKNSWKITCPENVTSDNDTEAHSMENKHYDSIASENIPEYPKADFRCDVPAASENTEVLKFKLKKQLSHIRRQRRLSKSSRCKGKNPNEQLPGFDQENDTDADISSDFYLPKENISASKRKRRNKSTRASLILSRSEEGKTPEVPKLPKRSNSKYQLRQPQGKKISYENYIQNFTCNRSCIACFNHEDQSKGGEQTDHSHDTKIPKDFKCLEANKSKENSPKQCAEEIVNLDKKANIETQEPSRSKCGISEAERNSENFVSETTPLPNDSGIGVDDDFMSNLSLSDTEGNVFLDSFIHQLNEEEARCSNQLEPLSAGDENSYHSTVADVKGDNSGHGKDGSSTDSNSLLNFPSVFDERDCLSIFDDFDFNIDSDLFEIENGKTESIDSSPQTVKYESTIQAHEATSSIDVIANLGHKDTMDISETCISEKKEAPLNIQQNQCISEEHLIGSEDQEAEKTSWAPPDFAYVPDTEAPPDLAYVPDTENAICPLAQQDYCQPIWQGHSSDSIQQALDADPSIPMTLLVPIGFCYHYLKDENCPFHPKCRFKHTRPSDAELYHHSVDTIKTMLQTGKFLWAMVVYRQLCKRTCDQLLPTSVLASLLSAAMDNFRIPDMFFILNEITRQNLFGKVICNKIIRLCWPQHLIYRVDLEKIFFAYMALNITPDVDCTLYMLHLFHATRNPPLLWELLCSLNEHIGFVVPAYIMDYALTCVTEHPLREVIIKYEQWVCTARHSALAPMTRNILSQLSSQLCHTVPHCAPALRKLIERPNEIKEKHVKTTIPEFSHIPVEKLKSPEQEEFKSYVHKINDCAAACDWTSLGEIFVELCSKEAPNNHHFILCYISALEDVHNPVMTVINCKRFFSTIIHEKNVNVFVTLDTSTLSQIFNQLLVTLFKRGQGNAATEIVAMIVDEKELYFVDCFPDDKGNEHHLTLNGVILSSLQACLFSRKFDLGLRVVEENLCYLHHLSSQWEQDLVMTCLEDLAGKMVTDPYQCMELCLLKQLLAISPTMRNSVAFKLSEIIVICVDHGDFITAAEMFHYLKRQSNLFNISPLLVRKFLSGCVAAGIDLPQDLLSCCINYVDYPKQIYSKRPSRQLNLQLGMTMSEIKLIINHYLTTLYSYFCDFVGQGQRLSMGDMNLLVQLLPGTVESLDVPFLGSAPCTMNILQEVVISAFNTLVPPIQASVDSSNGMMYLEPLDLANFLQQEDVKDGRPKLWRQLQGLL